MKMKHVIGALVICMMAASAAMAGMTQGPIGSLTTTDNGGLIGGGTWDSKTTTFSWDVWYNEDGVDADHPLFKWWYEYTFETNSTGGLSAIVVQVTQDVAPNNFSHDSVYQILNAVVPYDDPVTYTSAGNVNFPSGASIYGFKFEDDKVDPKWDTNVTFSFWSDHKPVLGSFFAKDGSVPQSNPKVWNYIYNSGLVAGATGAFVIVPDGKETPPPVPEPLTMASAFLAIGGLGAYIRRRTGRAAA